MPSIDKLEIPVYSQSAIVSGITRKRVVGSLINFQSRSIQESYRKRAFHRDIADRQSVWISDGLKAHSGFGSSGMLEGEIHDHRVISKVDHSRF